MKNERVETDRWAVAIMEARTSTHPLPQTLGQCAEAGQELHNDPKSFSSVNALFGSMGEAAFLSTAIFPDLHFG